MGAMFCFAYCMAQRHRAAAAWQAVWCIKNLDVAVGIVTLYFGHSEQNQHLTCFSEDQTAGTG